LELKESQEEVIVLAGKLNTLNSNSGSQKDRVVLVFNGVKVNIDENKHEAATEVKPEDCISDLSLEGNENISNDYEIQEECDETVLNEHETRLSYESDTCFSKFRDGLREEMSDCNDSGIESIISDFDVVSDQSEVDKSLEDFIDEDGIIYMFVSGSSMTCQYILLEEEEDENWFPKTKVYEEVGTFLNCQHQIVGGKNCAQRKSDLNTSLEGLKKGMADNVINDEFLNFAFMNLYETIEGLG